MVHSVYMSEVWWFVSDEGKLKNKVMLLFFYPFDPGNWAQSLVHAKHMLPPKSIKFSEYRVSFLKGYTHNLTKIFLILKNYIKIGFGVRDMLLW